MVLPHQMAILILTLLPRFFFELERDQTRSAVWAFLWALNYTHRAEQTYYQS